VSRDLLRVGRIRLLPPAADPSFGEVNDAGGWSVQADDLWYPNVQVLVIDNVTGQTLRNESRSCNNPGEAKIQAK
jgi:hypothetical protein